MKKNEIGQWPYYYLDYYLNCYLDYHLDIHIRVLFLNSTQMHSKQKNLHNSLKMVDTLNQNFMETLLIIESDL